MNNTVASAPAMPGASTTDRTTLWTWPRVTLAVIFTLSVIAVGTMLGLFASWKNSGLIAPGLVVQGESLGGLSKDEAQARLEKRFGRLFVSLETPDRPYKLALHQLGGEVLVPQ